MILRISFLCAVLSSTAFAHDNESPTVVYDPPSWLTVKIHHSPDCLHKKGWHDIAGALSFAGVHHVFQGCPSDGGWSHAASTDLVHWQDWGIHDGLKAIHETYEGMDSNQSPCSGFVTTTDFSDHVCAGFRQCSSNKGVTGINPQAHPWDVPLELRCAKNRNLTEWGEPEYLFPVYYYRALPYDPVRPWKDNDGKWYVALATDGCNSTTKKLPCEAGGQLDLWKANVFKGPWTHVGPMFTTNTEKSGTHEAANIKAEFVTPDYIGGLPGDPMDGRTRVAFQSGYWTGTSFWVGQQENGGQFDPYWNKTGAVGHYDYGDLFMARTLGSHDANQVAHNGRRVLIGWVSVTHGGSGVDPFASQSLPRDLSLSSNYELLQQFVPELQILRKPSTYLSIPFDNATQANFVLANSFPRSRQVEIVVNFTFNTSKPPAERFGVEVLVSQSTPQSTKLLVDCTGGVQNCFVGLDTTMQRGRKVTGPSLPIVTTEQANVTSIYLHAIVDGPIVEAIFNNRTAMALMTQPALETDTGVRIFGPAPQGHLQTWELMGTEDRMPEENAKLIDIFL